MLLGIGLVVRVTTMLVYDTAVFRYNGGDSDRYLRLFNHHGLFSDPGMPAGYPAFLRALRELWSPLPFTIGVQHLLGLVTAALLFATVRRFGGPRWLGLIPAGVAALGGDQIFLEHALLTEALWPVTIAVGLYALARAYDERSTGWLAAAGALLALSALVRNSSLLLPLVAAGWAAVALGGPGRARLRSAVAVAVPALVVLGGYVALARTVGDHDGLVERGGFSLYIRVAPFADCTRFHPPAGTERLCDSTPPDRRNGPGHYGFNEDAPLFREYQGMVSSDLLGRFAVQAIVHQPLDYLRAVTKDEVRLLAPEIGAHRPESGGEPADLSFGSTAPFGQGSPGHEAARETLAKIYGLVYSAVGRPKAAGAGFALLGAYQEIFRLDRLLLLAVIVIAVAGLARGRGRLRTGAALFGLCALVLYVLPPALVEGDVRFAATPAPLAAAAAALAGASLWERRRDAAEP